VSSKRVELKYRELLRNIRREEAKRLKNATYLSLNDILVSGFHKQPSTIIIEGGNGIGKTQSVCDYIALIQELEVFDRIYFLNFSQSACRNVVDKLLKLDSKVIWYIGIDKHCTNRQLLSKLVKYCDSPSYACYICPYWKGKHKYIYVKFINSLTDTTVKLVKPEITHFPYPTCSQPLFRAYFLDPAFEESRKLRIGYTPIIVAPSQLFITHTVISRFEKYQRRQKKDRKQLLIVDEADTVFYQSLVIKLPELNFTQDDYDILRMFSPKTKKLERLIDIYNMVIDLCKDIINSRGLLNRSHIERYLNYKQHSEKLLRSFNARRKQILQYVVDNDVKTNVFRMVNALEEFMHISSPIYTLRTVEYDGNNYILYDYEFAVKVLLDTSYPFKYFWKIILSATFPTEEILKSNYVSSRTKRKILKVEKKYRSYVNVYVAKYEIFRKDYGVLNRNREIRFAIKNILDCIIDAVKTYHRYFDQKANGVVVWFGNKYQYNYFLNVLKKNRVKFIYKGSFAYFRVKIDDEELTILMSYVGSAFSRSVDLDKYNISIAVAPLLRPPRNKRTWDVLDYSKAVADTLQAVMRVVRSPRPRSPKLLIFDHTILSAFYYNFMPKWFRELLQYGKVKLLSQIERSRQAKS